MDDLHSGKNPDAQAAGSGPERKSLESPVISVYVV